MSAPAPNYVSIIGFNYIPAILALTEKLLDLPAGKPNELQSRHDENGYAAATIAVMVFLVESAIARAQYDMHVKPPKQPLIFLRDSLHAFPHLAEARELFVVRDVIAHNHVWEASFDWTASYGMKLNWAQLTSGYGDKKLSTVLDPSTRKSKSLGLNLFPNRISRSDAFVVLRTAVKIVLYLEENATPLVNISNQYELFRGDLVPFTSVVDGLPLE
jgi:hypothetical protein